MQTDVAAPSLFKGNLPTPSRVYPQQNRPFVHLAATASEVRVYVKKTNLLKVRSMLKIAEGLGNDSWPDISWCVWPMTELGR